MWEMIDRNLLSNPLIVKSVRERLRPQHAISWGLVVVVLTAFVYIICYMGASNYTDLQDLMAAKFALVAILVLQAIILMLIGTGAVATGIVQERAAGVLDYQRMTPMHPGAKIVGYLFGLPIREYFLVALTMPFVIYAAVVAEVSFLTLAHLYFVGMISVLLYHMTGMVAGMIAPKPWKAGVATQAMVLVMYFVLPMIGRWGFTFFLYLTARPVFARLAYEELNLDNVGLVDISEWQRSVHFYGWDLHPTAFTLLIQGFFLAALFVIVYRKWREETRHPFSKPFSLIFFAVTQFLLVGSLWPWLTDAAKYKEVEQNLEGMWAFRLRGSEPGDVVIGVLLGVFFCVSGAAAVLLTNLITPTRHEYAKGVRRSFKLGRTRVPVGSDAASGIPFAASFVVLTLISYVLLLKLALSSDRFFSAPPPLEATVMLAALFAGTVMYVQGLRERWGMRGQMMGLFILWVIPFLVFITLNVAAGSPRERSTLPEMSFYAASPMPINALIYSITHLFDELPMQGDLREDRLLLKHAGRLTMVSTLLAMGLAIGFTSSAVQHFRAIREREQARAATPTATPQPTEVTETIVAELIQEEESPAV